tara:strand:- start:211 stop:972 length:762 start_codon:yes stop_codon:yes gene_type:complete
MTNDICRETIFTEYFNSRNEHCQKSSCQTEASKIQSLANDLTAYVSKFANDNPKCRASDEYRIESYVIASDILRRELVDRCISHRHYEDKNNLITIDAGTYFNIKDAGIVHNIKENYLLNTVKELKSEIDAVKMAMSHNETRLLNTVKELKNEVDTLKAVISGKGDVMDSVMVIQRYWRRYLLVKNVKKFARQYEAMLIEDYRKTLTSGIGTSRETLLKAVESRVKRPVKVSRSTPSNWSDSKAASIASDWNN